MVLLIMVYIDHEKLGEERAKDFDSEQFTKEVYQGQGNKWYSLPNLRRFEEESRKKGKDIVVSCCV